MGDAQRYQLCAYVFDSGAVTRFVPHGWATGGHIAILAPKSVRNIVVRSHTCFEVWDMMLPSYIMQTSKPPPVVGLYEDLDQAIMATTLKGDVP